jgi:hypothetical protein
VAFQALAGYLVHITSRAAEAVYLVAAKCLSFRFGP